MENLPSLSIESFSRSWLVNLNPTSDALEQQQYSCSTSFDASDEASFIEMDPKLSDSRRFYKVAKDFSFDFRAFESSVTLAEADERITDGLLMPKSQTHNTNEYYRAGPPTPRLMSSFSQKEANSSNRMIPRASLRRCKTLTKRVFQKYLDFLGPLCRKLRRRRSGSRVASVSNQFDPCLLETSPKTTAGGCTNNNGRKFWESECSITDAVLHCKRTNGCA